jgi:hypothetical protein
VERHRGDLEAEADDEQRDAGEHERVLALDRHGAVERARISSKFVEPVPP